MRASDVLLPPLDARIASCARSRTATPTCRCSRARTASRPAHDARQGVRQLRVRGCAAPGERWSQPSRSLGKCNGAVGNFNAHAGRLSGARLAGGRAPASSSRSGLECNPYTTQIEPHDWIGRVLSTLWRASTRSSSISAAISGATSRLGYFRQRAVAGEVGSSTMPHKVNPIDFENAEGNLGVANALLRHLADKLPISRWQRDLTRLHRAAQSRRRARSYPDRLRLLPAGLGKLDADPERIAADLDDRWEVLAEADADRHAAPRPRRRLRTAQRAHARPRDRPRRPAPIHRRPRAASGRTRELLPLTPSAYTGLAARFARRSDASPRDPLHAARFRQNVTCGTAAIGPLSKLVSRRERRHARNKGTDQNQRRTTSAVEPRRRARGGRRRHGQGEPHAVDLHPRSRTRPFTITTISSRR